MPINYLQPESCKYNIATEKEFNKKENHNDPSFKGYIKKGSGILFVCLALESIGKVFFGKGVTENFFKHSLWEKVPTRPVLEHIDNILLFSAAAVLGLYAGWHLIRSRDYWWIKKRNLF